jgi:hypothetical protein
MLENLDRLLSQLTLGGLRRWLVFGAQAYKADFEGQIKYFSLQSADALSVLQAERKGTLFVDVQRRLNIYLRAMWGRDFFLRPTAGDYEQREGLKPYIERFLIYIADAYDDYRPFGEDTPPLGLVSGMEVYRAAPNHCAAHLVFTQAPLSMQMLNPTQMAVIEAIEDFKPALTVIDEGGLGYGILDRLTEQRYKVRGVNFGWKAKNPVMWGNKRAELWGAMRDWLKTAAIKEDRQLRSDLTGPKTKPDSSGTIFLESKKDMKARGLASPDAADAIAVTFAFPVASRERVEKPRTLVARERLGMSASWLGA